MKNFIMGSGHDPLTQTYWEGRSKFMARGRDLLKIIMMSISKINRYIKA